MYHGPTLGFAHIVTKLTLLPLPTSSYASDTEQLGEGTVLAKVGFFSVSILQYRGNCLGLHRLGWNEEMIIDADYR